MKKFEDLKSKINEALEVKSKTETRAKKELEATLIVELTQFFNCPLVYGEMIAVYYTEKRSNGVFETVAVGFLNSVSETNINLSSRKSTGEDGADTTKTYSPVVVDISKITGIDILQVINEVNEKNHG